MIVPLWDQGEGFRSAPVSRQRRLNAYIEPQKAQDKTTISVYGTHGLTLFTNGLGASIVRGARTITQSGITYLVAGNTVYAINAAATIIPLGTINSTSGRVSMSDNGSQILLVDGVNGWVIPFTTNTPVQITDPNFPNGATTCTFIAGFFIVNAPNSGRFYWSNVFDGTTWGALQFATAESDPDNLLAVWQSHNELLLFGERTIEIWSPSGDANVFLKMGGAAVEWGLAAVFSVDRFGEGLIYLAKNRMGQYQVATLNAYTSTPVSTPEIEFDLQQRPSIAGATAYSYLWFGHPMYQINFPDKSYLYDGYADAWSEVGSGVSGGPIGRHYGEVRFELLSLPYVSDYRNGNIYKVDAFNYTDNGDPITTRIHFKHVFEPGLGYLTIDEFQIDLEAGIGNAVDPGSNPDLMFRLSQDGGRTYGNERQMAMGAQGAYLTKAYVLGCGCARDFVAEIKVTDPVKRVFVNPQLRMR